MLIRPNQITILCSSCGVKPAVRFIAVTFEIVSKQTIQLKLVQVALCEPCAMNMDANLAIDDQVAVALAGGKR